MAWAGFYADGTKYELPFSTDRWAPSLCSSFGTCAGRV